MEYAIHCVGAVEIFIRAKTALPRGKSRAAPTRVF
jgi:hypothetical protein